MSKLTSGQGENIFLQGSICKHIGIESPDEVVDGLAIAEASVNLSHAVEQLAQLNHARLLKRAEYENADEQHRAMFRHAQRLEERIRDIMKGLR